MPASEEDELPGVFIILVDVHEKASQAREGMVHISMRVNTTVTDMEVWKAVEAKMREGVKIYTENDFKGLLLESLREEHISLEKKVVQLERENKRLQDENRRMSAGLSVLHQQLEG